jgi:glycosyltransferase 2 family protein
VRTLFTRKTAIEVEQEAESGGVVEKRPPWGALIRIAVTLLILGLIFRSVDLQSVLDHAKDIVPRLLLLGILLQLLSTTLAAYRWYLVMKPLGYGQEFGFYLRSYFKGAFFNQGLPTSIGGDAIRVIDVARKGCRKRDAFYGVFIDRVLGLVGLLILNITANALNPDLLPQGIFLTINLLVASGILGFIVLLLLRRLDWLKRWRFTRLFHTISQNLSRVLVTPRDYVLQLGLSVAVHFLSLVAIFLVGRSVEMPFDLLTFLIIVPPVLLLTLIPLSLAGWGIREGAMIGLFTLLGADKVSVLTMSILYGLVLVIASMPGLQIYLKGKHHL